MIIAAMIVEDVDIVHAKTRNHVAQMSRNVVEKETTREKEGLIDLIMKRKKSLQKKDPEILNPKKRVINNMISSDYLINITLRNAIFVNSKRSFVYWYLIEVIHFFC